MNTPETILRIKTHKRILAIQQYKTLKGQILSGNAEGAMKGLNRLIRRQKEK